MVRAQQKRQVEPTKTTDAVLCRKTTHQIKYDVVNCLAKYIHEISHPDFSELKADLEQVEFVIMKMYPDEFMTHPETGEQVNVSVPERLKVLYVLDNCAILQELHLNEGDTRYKTFRVMFGHEWDTMFKGWITPVNQEYDGEYQECVDSWKNGICEYGFEL